MSYRIKDWRKFQHYKHRDPPWIRLYRNLLNDREWFALDGEASKMLINCWLIASERDGTLPSAADMAFRFRMTEKQINSILSRLSHWMEQDAITALAPRYQDAPTETETETEIVLKSDWPKDFRERFWEAYPRRVGKKAAIRKLEVVWREGEVGFAVLLSAVGAIDTKDLKFVPHPETWLNKGHYLDHSPTPCSLPPERVEELIAKHQQKQAEQL